MQNYYLRQVPIDPSIHMGYYYIVATHLPGVLGPGVVNLASNTSFGYTAQNASQQEYACLCMHSACGTYAHAIVWGTQALSAR